MSRGTFSVALVSTLLVLEFGPTPQSKLGFYCKNPNLSLPFKGDTISLGLLLGVSLVVPLLIITAVELFREKTVNKNWGIEIWRWYRDYLIGITVNLAIVQVSKVVIGEHRPHFLTTCLPDTGQTCVAGEYVETFKCTSTMYSNYIITDSSRSFPSGHASVSVFASFFTAFFIHCRLPSRRTRSVIKPFIIVLVLIWSVVCSLTRISDYRHHWWDVLAGVFVGIASVFYTIGTLCKFFEHPSISAKIHRPSVSTTALLDVKNKDATSVII